MTRAAWESPPDSAFSGPALVAIIFNSLTPGSRARQPGNVPSDLNACYYAQRASAALIVTEATQVSQQAGLRLDARHSQPRTSRGLAPRHRRGAQGRRPDLPAALARRTHLLDQFINSGSNHRADGYGGAIENRARLLMEVVEAVSDVWGQDRVGVRLSPLGTFNDMGDDEPEATFSTIAKTLGDHSLAYLHIINPAIVGAIAKEIEPDPGALRMLELMRERYRGTLIIAGGFDHDTAEGWLRQGKADLIAFGRKFLANPDLPERFRAHASLNADDPSTYYGGGAKGYTDYPTLARERGEDPHPCVDERWR